MRNIAILVSAFFALGLSTSSFAQSLFERCEKRKAEIGAMEIQVQGMDSELVNLDNRLEKLTRRQTELREKKALVVREKATLQKRIEIENAGLNQMCIHLRRCEVLERRIDKLKERLAPLAELQRKIREEIQSQGSVAAQLNREVDRIETSYQQLNCDNLIPGRTAQSTIEHCADLFSRWNDMQVDINQLNASVAALQSRYQQSMKDTHSYRMDLDKLLAEMRTACSHSTWLAELENLDKEQQGYRSMKVELENMDSTVKKFRKFKMLKPKVDALKQPKPKEKEKPILKPRGKEKHSIQPIR